MITHCLDVSARSKLWRAYVDIDYGRNQDASITPGFKSFVKSQTGADVVVRVDADHYDLKFNNETIYTWYMLKWL